VAGQGPRSPRLLEEVESPKAPLMGTIVVAEYLAYEGPPGPDPRTVNVGEVADALCRIVEAEGPVLAKRAYGIYLRGCAINRMRHGLKSLMNKALSSGIRRGLIVSENDPNRRGLINSTVRSVGSPPTILRVRGPRTFDEIPPGEWRALGRHV